MSPCHAPASTLLAVAAVVTVGCSDEGGRDYAVDTGASASFDPPVIVDVANWMSHSNDCVEVRQSLDFETDEVRGHPLSFYQDLVDVSATVAMEGPESRLGDMQIETGRMEGALSWTFKAGSCNVSRGTLESMIPVSVQLPALGIDTAVEGTMLLRVASQIVYGFAYFDLPDGVPIAGERGGTLKLVFHEGVDEVVLRDAQDNPVAWSKGADVGLE
jgi:hypothetical protein